MFEGDGLYLCFAVRQCDRVAVEKRSNGLWNPVETELMFIIFEQIDWWTVSKHKHCLIRGVARTSNYLVG